MTYQEKLKDPRWQKKRLEIMERDGFACRICMAKDKTLVVHHLEYGAEPWDIPNESLVTLCELHHDLIEKNIKWFRAFSVRFFPQFQSLEGCFDCNRDRLMEQVLSNLELETGLGRAIAAMVEAYNEGIQVGESMPKP